MTLRTTVMLLCAIAIGALSERAAADYAVLNQRHCVKQITYRSDKDTAYRYLENQQRAIYTQNPELADPYSRAELNSPRSVRTFATLKARALEACPDPAIRAQCALNPDLADKLMKTFACLSLPTRFEAPLFITLIGLYSEDLARVQKSRLQKVALTRFGSLPTGTFDAQAIVPPGSKTPLVILNRDIFFLTGALSKAISDAIPITTGQAIGLDYTEAGIRERLLDHPHIVQNFADAISRLVQGGSSAGAMEVTLDDIHNHLHARLVSAMDMFLIAHEEAHVILGHVSDQSVAFRLAGSHRRADSPEEPSSAASTGGNLSITSNRAIEATSTALKAQLRTREQELEADALGFKLLIWSEELHDDRIAIMIAAAAPHIVFRALDAAGAYGSESGGWTFSESNHPSAADRVQALSQVFDEVARTSEPMRVVDFRVPFDAAFGVLIAEADPLIRRRLGLPPKTAK